MIDWNRELQKGVGDSGVPILCQGLAPYQSADWGKSRLDQTGTQIRPCYLTTRWFFGLVALKAGTVEFWWVCSRLEKEKWGDGP